MRRFDSIRDLALTIVVAKITFGAAACAGPKVVDDPARMERLRETIARFEPRVIELLGTRLEREYEVHVLADEARAMATTRYPGRDLYFSPRAFDDVETLESTVAHELVHVHATGIWDALPEVMEQGLAQYVGVLARAPPDATGARYTSPDPDLAKLVAALRLDDVEYMREHQDDDVTEAALWLVCRLGIDGTRRIAEILAERESHADLLTTAAALQSR